MLLTRRLAAATLAVCFLFAIPSLPILAQAAAGVVNVNTAGADELSLLPRVGPTVAQRILDYREANGPFKTVEDLMLVRGIGERTFELLRPYVTLEGKTTLREKVRSGSSADTDPEEG